MKIDPNIFKKYIDDRLISVQKHPEFDYYIYNYTQKAQFDGIDSWTPELKMCRGLILDGEGTVIARPFDKFFNLEQHVSFPSCPFKAYDKADGSLGIMYKNPKGKYCIATRGSFVSEQAIKGTEMLQRVIEEIRERISFDSQWTQLFEIIYPENRIVVDYKGENKLIHLASRNIETGEVIPSGIPLQEYLTPRDNAEGVVLYYENGFMVKVKYEEYKRLHRLVTGVNKKTIWELLRAHQLFEELLDRVPDEFFQWVKDTRHELNNEFEVIEQVVCSHILEEVQGLSTRKEQAFALMKNVEWKEYSGIIFKMLDKQPYEDIIWKMIRPQAEKPFKKDIDT